MAAVALYFSFEKNRNGSIHFQTNKDMRCIVAIACLKHAMQKL